MDFYVIFIIKEKGIALKNLKYIRDGLINWDVERDKWRNTDR